MFVGTTPLPRAPNRDQPGAKWRRQRRAADPATLRSCPKTTAALNPALSSVPAWPPALSVWRRSSRTLRACNGPGAMPRKNASATCSAAPLPEATWSTPTFPIVVVQPLKPPPKPRPKQQRRRQRTQHLRRRHNHLAPHVCRRAPQTRANNNCATRSLRGRHRRRSDRFKPLARRHGSTITLTRGGHRTADHT